MEKTPVSMQNKSIYGTNISQTYLRICNISFSHYRIVGNVGRDRAITVDEVRRQGLQFGKY